MEILWTTHAADDLEYWKRHNPKIINKIKELIENIKVSPYTGIGKPEPLKHDLSGCWSRRITGDNRIVYKVKSRDEVVILQCRYHYR